jgi:hypothetical protein
MSAVNFNSQARDTGFGLDRYIEHPLILEQGIAIAPLRPGHGVSFDW